MSMKMKFRIIVGMLFAVWLLTDIGASTQVLAEELPPGEDACRALDIMLLIDQSWSMHSPYPPDVPVDERTPPSDPEDYRFQAAKEVLDQLILNRQEGCSEAVHRFGLITFGHEANIVLPLVHIDLSSTDDPELWTEDYKEAIEEASEDHAQQGTDFMKAIDAAEEVFESASPIPDPEGYAPRHRVLVILTDGNPAGVGNVPDYMCELVDTLNSSAWEGFSLWVVALNASQPYLDNSGCGGTIRSDWQEVVSQHRGRLHALPYNEQNIPAFLADIVNEEFRTPGAPITCGESFFVDPYLQQVKFTFYHRREDAELGITLQKIEDGTPVFSITGDSDETYEGMSLANYESGEIKTEYILDLPRPGAWRFDVEGLSVEDCQSRFVARKQPLVAEVNLLQPKGILAQVSEEPFYDEAEPIYYVVGLSTDSGAPVASESDYPLVVKVNIKLPSGSDTLPNGQSVPSLELYAESEGRWTNTEEPVLVPEEGVYELILEGETLRGNEQSEYAVFTRTISYEARHLEKFGFEVDFPTYNEIMYCNRVEEGALVGEPIDVHVKLLDAGGALADPQRYLTSNSGQAFQARLVDSEGNTLDETVLTPSNDLGVFTGQLAKGSTLVGCGNVVVEVEFVGEYDGARFTMPATSEEVPVARVRAEGVRVKPSEPVSGTKILLHPDFRAALPWSESIQPVQLKLETLDLNGNRVDPETVASSEPGELYRVRLVGPDPERWEELELKRVELVDGPALVASGGISITTPGTYYFEIKPQGDAFSMSYRPARENALTIVFEREDTLWTTPLTYKVILGFLALLLLILLAIVGWNFFTRPRGALYFTRNSILLHSESLDGSWKHTYVSKDSEIDTICLSRIEVTKAEPDLEEGHRAVEVQLFDSDGDNLLMETLNSGEATFYFCKDAEVEVKYE